MASLVQKLQRFYLVVELHWEGSAPAACAAGLFVYKLMCFNLCEHNQTKGSQLLVIYSTEARLSYHNF